MKGIIYTRVSSDEQVKGTSLDDQDLKCRQYCAEKGIEVIKIFREEGASAKSADRKIFLEAINFCAKSKGEIQAFVVLRVDRFARNTEDHFSVRKILADYKVTLHSVTEPIGNNPIEKFMETLLAASAEFDNSIRAKRCSDGMIARMREGLWPWKPPIGYTCFGFKKQGQKKSAPDQPDPVIFPIIQKALKEYATGMFTQSDIIKLLDHEGFSKITGKKTTLQFVDRILTSQLKFYAGIISNNMLGDQEFPGKHIPMITKDEMEKIIMIRSGKRVQIKHQRQNPKFPLRKVVRCECGKPMSGSSPKGNGGSYDYYHCSDQYCAIRPRFIRKDVLEDAFMKELQKILPGEEFMQMYTESVLEEWKDRGMLFESHANVYAKKIAELEEQKKKASRMREDGEYTPEEFKERKTEIENAIVAEKISLSESRIEQFDVEGALAYAKHFINDLARQWFDCPIQLQIRFQKLVFPQGITFNRESKFLNHELGCIFRLNQEYKLKKGEISNLVVLF